MYQLSNLRKIPISVVMFAVVVLASANIANADTFDFAQGGFINGLPVSATAHLEGTAGTSLLTLVLNNTSAGHTSVAQALVGFQFTICDANGNPLAITVTSIASQNGRLIQFNNSTTAVDFDGSSDTDPLGWGVSATLGVTALGFTGSGTNPPDEAILGPPNVGLTYTGANASITNNGSHQPFVKETATFSLNLSGNLPEGFCICEDVTFFFNTDGTPLTNVPEPASMLLLGTGLIGVASSLRRRFKKS